MSLFMSEDSDSYFFLEGVEATRFATHAHDLVDERAFLLDGDGVPFSWTPIVRRSLPLPSDLLFVLLTSLVHCMTNLVTDFRWPPRMSNRD